jgi:hypothetical protein
MKVCPGVGKYFPHERVSEEVDIFFIKEEFCSILILFVSLTLFSFVKIYTYFYNIFFKRFIMSVVPNSFLNLYFLNIQKNVSVLWIHIFRNSFRLQSTA